MKRNDQHMSEPVLEHAADLSLRRTILPTGQIEIAAPVDNFRGRCPAQSKAGQLHSISVLSYPWPVKCVRSLTPPKPHGFLADSQPNAPQAEPCHTCRLAYLQFRAPVLNPTHPTDQIVMGWRCDNRQSSNHGKLDL